MIRGHPLARDFIVYMESSSVIQQLLCDFRCKVKRFLSGRSWDSSEADELEETEESATKTNCTEAQYICVRITVIAVK